jgi:hypothetical protein
MQKEVAVNNYIKRLKKFEKNVEDDKGWVTLFLLVTFAITFLALYMMLVDGGKIMYTRRSAIVNGSTAARLGTQYTVLNADGDIVIDESFAISSVYDWLTEKGYTDTNVMIVCPNDICNVIQVTIHKDVDFSLYPGSKTVTEIEIATVQSGVHEPE